MEALEPAAYVVGVLYAVPADVGGLVVLLPERVVTAAACVAHGVFLNYYPAVCGCVVAVVQAVPLSVRIHWVVQVRYSLQCGSIEYTQCGFCGKSYPFGNPIAPRYHKPITLYLSRFFSFFIAGK